MELQLRSQAQVGRYWWNTPLTCSAIPCLNCSTLTRPQPQKLTRICFIGYYNELLSWHRRRYKQLFTTWWCKQTEFSKWHSAGISGIPTAARIHTSEVQRHASWRCCTVQHGDSEVEEDRRGAWGGEKKKNCTWDFPMILTDVLRYASAVHEYFIWAERRCELRRYPRPLLEPFLSFGGQNKKRVWASAVIRPRLCYWEQHPIASAPTRSPD